MSLFEAVQKLEKNQKAIYGRAATEVDKIAQYALAVMNPQNTLFQGLTHDQRVRLFDELTNMQELARKRPGQATFSFDKLRETFDLGAPTTVPPPGVGPAELYQGGTIMEKPQSLMQRRTGIGQVN